MRPLLKLKLGAIEFCERMNIPYYKNDVFRTFNVSKRQSYEMLRPDSSSRRRHNDPEEEETRGRKGLITPKHIREMEKILEEEGFEARALTWEQLGFEMSLECSGNTVKRAMGTMNYHKCVACRKGWFSQRTATKRVEYSVVMLERYLKKRTDGPFDSAMKFTLATNHRESCELYENQAKDTV